MKIENTLFILGLIVIVLITGIVVLADDNVRIRTERCYDSKAFDRACIVERLENIESKLNELLEKSK